MESSSQENLQQLESLQEAKNALEEQLKKETAAKVAMMSGCEVYLHLLWWAAVSENVALPKNEKKQLLNVGKKLAGQKCPLDAV